MAALVLLSPTRGGPHPCPRLAALQAAVELKSKEGLEAGAIMERGGYLIRGGSGAPAANLSAALGRMVPDKVVNAILEARIGEGDCDKGFVLDGYPRTLAQVGGPLMAAPRGGWVLSGAGQAKRLEKMLSKAGDRVETVAVLDVPFKVLEDRVTGRWTHFSSGRSYHVAYKPPKSLVEAREQAGPNVEASRCRRPALCATRLTLL